MLLYKSDSVNSCGFCHFYTVLIAFIMVTQTTSEKRISCQSRQYFYVNRQNIINCSVSEGVYAYYWYYEDDPQSIVTLLENQQAGPRSHELKIARNGSLIFSNVTVADEGSYKIDVILAAGGDVSTVVQVVVIVPTSEPFPIVDKCGRNSYCNLCCDKEYTLHCKMIGRPAVYLTWNSNSNITGFIQNPCPAPSEDNMFRSCISIDVSVGTGESLLLKCVPSGLAVTENTKATSVHVWGPTDPNHVTKIVYNKPHERPTYASLLGKNFSNETLMIQTAGIQFDPQDSRCEVVNNDDMYLDSGPQIVTLLNGQSKSHSIENVLVSRYKFPDISSSFIENCVAVHNCTIYVLGDEVTLSCTANKTRPPANIEWKIKDPAAASILSVSSRTSCLLNDCCSTVNVSVKVMGAAADLECIVSIPESDFNQTWTVTLKRNDSDVSSTTHSTNAIPTISSNNVSDSRASTTQSNVEGWHGDSGRRKVCVAAIVVTSLAVAGAVAVLLLNFAKPKSKTRKKLRKKPASGNQEELQNMREKEVTSVEVVS